jgi:aspartyl-tRNA(Asn)/glutamyl-tRNA(Gln) amidotransferase subunit A
MYPLLSGWETLDRRLAHYGPLTRTVANAAMMMEVMAGPNDRDPLSLPRDRINYRQEMKKGIRGLRIAWSRDLGHVVVDPRVQEAVEGAARVFSRMSCDVEEATPKFPLMHDAFRLLFAADCAGAIGTKLDEWKDRLDPGLVMLTEIGLKASAVDYVRAVNRCHVLWEGLQAFFAKYDLLLTPTLPLPAFPVGIDWPREVAGQKVHPLNYLGFTYPFNLTGQPAASLLLLDGRWFTHWPPDRGRAF